MYLDECVFDISYLDFDALYLAKALPDDGRDINTPEKCPNTAVETFAGGTWHSRSRNGARGFITLAGIVYLEDFADFDVLYLVQAFFDDEREIGTREKCPEAAVEAVAGGTRPSRSQNEARGFIKLAVESEIRRNQRYRYDLEDSAELNDIADCNFAYWNLDIPANFDLVTFLIDAFGRPGWHGSPG